MLKHLRQIAIFAKTAELGSFRATAKNLRLSPSVVSHHITQLEEHLGVPLFYRSTRKMSLTRDGERLITSAKAMVDAAEEGLCSISEKAPEPSGELHVTVPSVLSKSHLVEKIAMFAISHPNVFLVLDFTDVRRDIIHDGIDVALSMGRLHDSTLKARKLLEVKRRVVAARSYLKEKPEPKTPEDLEGWDWLELSPVRLKPVFRKSPHQRITLKPNVRLRANDAHALYHLVRSGAGLATLPEFLVTEDITAGITQFVLPDWQLEPLGIYAVWPPNAVKNSLTMRFVDYLTAYAN